MPYYEFKPIALDSCLELGHDLPKALKQAQKYQDTLITRKWERILLPTATSITGLIAGVLMILIHQGHGTVSNMGFVAVVLLFFCLMFVTGSITTASEWSDKWSNILADDRFKLVQSLLEDIRVWNEEVILFNRLLDQIDLKLIDGLELQHVIDRLYDDERFLRAKIEYTERRLQESRLGQPLVRSLPTMAILDETEDWRERVRDNRRELETTAQRMLAHYEVEAAFKR